MLVVLMGAALSSDQVDAKLTYRHSEAYALGARERLPPTASVQGLRLPDVSVVRLAASRVLKGRALWVVKAFTYAIPFRQLLQIVDVLWLFRVFRRSRCDVVHLNNGGFPGGASCNAAAVAARMAKIPVVVYVVNNIAEGYRSPLRWADSPLDRLTARCVTRFVTGSEEAASALVRVLRLPACRVAVIHNGIAVRHPGRSSDSVRSDLNIGPDIVLIAVIARLEKRKGHRFLIEALAELTRGEVTADWMLVIEGSGPEEASLRALAADRGIGANVRFIGAMANIWDLYVAADLVVLPSVDHEDFPNVTIEAMAVARPVIASALAGTTEQVVDGETGLLVPPGDVGALTTALARLIGDGGAREDMGRNGRARFEKEFSAAAAAQRYWDLYKQLLSDRS